MMRVLLLVASGFLSTSECFRIPSFQHPLFRSRGRAAITRRIRGGWSENYSDGSSTNHVHHASINPENEENSPLSSAESLLPIPNGEVLAANSTDPAVLVSLAQLQLIAAETPPSSSSAHKYSYQIYDWHQFLPKGGGVVGAWRKARWIITGSTLDICVESDEQTRQNLAALARLLILLRTYEKKFGLPRFGGPEAQRKVLADITADLHSSGTPTWVLETVMGRVAEGLTGREGVQFLLFPRKGLIFYPATNQSTPVIEMVRLDPGYDIARMETIERIAVRLASFAGNTQTAERMNPSAVRVPHKLELVEAKQNAMQALSGLSEENLTAGELADEIFNLASSTYGLFYFLNNPKFQQAINETDPDDLFWEVKDSTKHTFTRLATYATSKSMEYVQNNEKRIYSKGIMSLCRVVSSAGACALWFGGSIWDMAASGILAAAVHKIGKTRALAYEERVLTEVASSFIVGLSAGVLALKWPNRFCFGAIPVAALLDLLQGFKVSFGVIEVMSKNIITGTARIFEGILFTGLISYSLLAGFRVAFRLLLGHPPTADDLSSMLVAVNGLDKRWFPLIIPFLTTAWSTLFWPNRDELPLMALHGILAYTLNLLGMPNFFAAMCVTFSAGLISRFTGRGALGNTYAGLYALVPGTYMVTKLLSPHSVGFVESVLTVAATIGVGGWAGTLLCSPTILGKTSGLHGWSPSRYKNEQRFQTKRENLLYF